MSLAIAHPQGVCGHNEPKAIQRISNNPNPDHRANDGPQ